MKRNQWAGHEYGDCLVQLPWVYVPIPKCASTWTKHAFGKTHSNFETDPDFPRDQAEYVVILREPIDRWISGLAQYHHGSLLTWHLHYRNLGWDRIFDQIVFDNHTEPQRTFIRNIDYDRVTWFQFGPSLTQDLYHWFQGRFEPRPHPEEKDDSQVNALIEKPALHPGRTLSGKEMLEEISTVVAQNSKYHQRLKDFYHKDYRLYESVPFYRAR